MALHQHRPWLETLSRTYGDLDGVIRREHKQRFSLLLQTLGYTPDQAFNALHGALRLLFYDEAHNRQIDVFVGKFQMCHTLDLNDRLCLHRDTLAPSDLLLTKLQIVQVNRKDIVDAVALLYEHEVTNEQIDDVLDLGRLIEVTSQDWGWFTTFTDNLVRVSGIAEEVLERDAVTQVVTRVSDIRDAL